MRILNKILDLSIYFHFDASGFERHKGYPTKQHLQALQELGPCPAHRRSFAPVQRVLAEQGAAL